MGDIFDGGTSSQAVKGPLYDKLKFFPAKTMRSVVFRKMLLLP
jgi:hypothetical protein